MASADVQRTAGSELRVLIADGDPAARRAFRESLSDLEDVAVVGEAADGSHTISAARESKPDVVLVDVDLPRLGGIATMRRIHAESPQTRVIQVATEDDEGLGMLVLLAGSAGFLVKGMDLGRLGAVVHGVYADEAAVSRRFTRRLIERLQTGPGR